MKVLLSLACAGLTMAAGPAFGADLFGTAPPSTYPAIQGPTTFEVGSNWYVRGDLGISLDNAPTLSLSSISTPPPGYFGAPLPAYAGTNMNSRDLTGGVGFGYRVNSYLRFDATWDYRNGPGGSSETTVVCPYALSGLTTQGAAPFLVGYLYNTSNTCDGAADIRQYNNTFLANGYVDLGTYAGFTPYVGGGLGFNMNVMSGSLNYYETANGQAYAADLTPTGALSADLGEPVRRCRSPRSPTSRLRRKTGTGRSTRPPTPWPSRCRPGSAFSSLRARRSTSAIATSTAARSTSWSIRRPA